MDVAEKSAGLELISNGKPDLSVNIYPNPSTDGHFKLALGDNFANKAVDLRILDISGKEIYCEAVQGNSLHLLRPNLNPGVYALLVKSEGESYTSKLVVE